MATNRELPASKKTGRELSFIKETITPDKAQEWLDEHNYGNRPISDSKVAMYARDIIHGDWFLTHECIAFDENGRLTNGQHRLKAIIKANKAVEFYVCRGEPAEAAMFIDQGRARSLTDAAKFFDENEELTRKAEAVAKSMMSPTMNGAFTRAQQWAFYQRHKPAIMLACGLFKGMPRQLQRAHLVAIIARASYTSDHERLRQFTESLPEGRWASPGDRGMASIRDYMMTEDFTSCAVRRHFYQRGEYLLSCYLQRKSRVAKKKVAETELFLIPGEKGFKKAA